MPVSTTLEGAQLSPVKADALHPSTPFGQGRWPNYYTTARVANITLDNPPPPRVWSAETPVFPRLSSLAGRSSTPTIDRLWLSVYHACVCTYDSRECSFLPPPLPALPLSLSPAIQLIKKKYIYISCRGGRAAINVSFCIAGVGGLRRQAGDAVRGDQHPGGGDSAGAGGAEGGECFPLRAHLSAVFVLLATAAAVCVLLAVRSTCLLASTGGDGALRSLTFLGSLLQTPSD